MMGHSRTTAVSSTGSDQRQRNFFVPYLVIMKRVTTRSPCAAENGDGFDWQTQAPACTPQRGSLAQARDREIDIWGDNQGVWRRMFLAGSKSRSTDGDLGQSHQKPETTVHEDSTGTQENIGNKQIREHFCVIPKST